MAQLLSDDFIKRLRPVLLYVERMMRGWVPGLNTSHQILSSGHADSGILDGDLDTNDEEATQTIDDERLTVQPTAKSRLGNMLEGMTVQVARYPDGTWRVIEGGKAREITVTADDAFEFDDPTIESTVAEWSDGEDPDPESEGLAVENGAGDLTFYGEAGTTLFCRYQPELDTYRVYQVSCPAPET